MKQSISHAREEYKLAYMELRIYSGAPYLFEKWFASNEVRDYALESYDYRDSHFDGWINRQRMDTFQAKALYRPEWDGLPF